MECRCLCSTIRNCLNVFQGKVTGNVVFSFNYTEKSVISTEIIIHRSKKYPDPGKSAFVWLYSGTKVDPSTGKGQLSDKVHLNHGKSNKKNGMKITTYKIRINLDPGFGIPGAFVIRNQHKHEFFLKSVTLLQADNNRDIHFSCNSWIYPTHKTNTNRVFFSNTCYLPNHTPDALAGLRKEELSSLRGNRIGERKEWDRIYDYDLYNDLGNPDKDPQHTRPVLGGSDLYSYPRRGRTGRPPSNKDPLTESRPAAFNLDIYVPRDERLSQKRLSEFISNAIEAAVHFVLPEAKSLIHGDSGHFKSFDEIRNLYNANRSKVKEGWIEKKVKHLVPEELFKMVERARMKNPMKFPLPPIISENEFAWKDDEEFGRQMLAGINPTVIKVLKKFPPESNYGARSSITQSDIQQNLDGLTLKQAMGQWRIFILDHHDYLMPFLNRINSKGVCAYASRTLLFLRNDATLKPLAIELSLPTTTSTDKEINRVFLPATQGTEAALWLSAKAHVAVNDSGYHQLITHWLNTHVVVEPFIIATRRQLSVMHPIHRLLDPHFKDTMHVNALARSFLINSGGILEKILFTNEISMEFSSALYKDWRFDEQALPADLLKRRMALKDSDNPTGVQLLFEDYPYGADGLEIWAAIQKWVTNFCSLFYMNDESVKSDTEIQAWWSEIRNVGHGDKREETWWYSMTTLADLIKSLTTLIWMTSALHASVNFGQYEYAGYPPNRPTLCRKFIPKEGTLEFADFLKDPDKFYLEMLPTRFEMTLSIALVEALSTHATDELHLGQLESPGWTHDERVLPIFLQFYNELKEVEKRIVERNRNPNLKNRWGPAKIAYRLLDPAILDDGYSGGITGKGIPNSISV